MCPNLRQEVEAARVDRLSKCKAASSLPLGGQKAHALTGVHGVNGVRSAWQCHVRFDGRRIHRVPLRASCILANCLHCSSTPARVVAISLLRCLDYVVLDRRPPTSDLRKYMSTCVCTYCCFVKAKHLISRCFITLEIMNTIRSEL